MKKHLLSIIALGFVATFAFGQSGWPRPSVDSLGTAIGLSKAATRVVSLSPACTEVLFAVGDHGPSAIRPTALPARGGQCHEDWGISASSMSVEKILSLKPGSGRQLGGYP